MPLQIKRIFEPAKPEDGYRVLVDRLWPRGISREKANLDAWLPKIAPSSELRRWFGHEPEKWQEFVDRYAEELAARDEMVEELLACTAEGMVTLLYAARDPQHNNALALLEYLDKLVSRKRKP